MAIVRILSALVITVVGMFAYDEAKAWLPRLTEKVMKIAICRLPKECRDRYSEEWESHVEDIPGEISRLMFSISLLRAAGGIANVCGKDGRNRVFNAAAASILLAFLAPNFLMIIAAIKLTSPGPVFVRYTRTRADGRRFTLLRFRTIAIQPSSSGPRLHLTQVGKFLRRTGLDHMPQLVNVFAGDVSFRGLLRGPED